MSAVRPGVSVSVDREVCVSSGTCASVAPAVFDQEDVDGRVILLESAPAEAETDRVLTAEDLCPARAISVHRP